MPEVIQAQPKDKGIGRLEFATFKGCGAGTPSGRDGGGGCWQELRCMVVIGDIQEGGNMSAMPCPMGSQVEPERRCPQK